MLEVGCEHGEVRLMYSTGSLQFCRDGKWGRICNTRKYWRPNNARVVCRQLGFYGEVQSMIEIARLSCTCEGFCTVCISPLATARLMSDIHSFSASYKH